MMGQLACVISRQVYGREVKQYKQVEVKYWQRDLSPFVESSIEYLQRMSDGNLIRLPTWISGS